VVYLPPAFSETRPEALRAHIERYPFGLLISHGENGLIASHVPFLFEGPPGDQRLLTHLARANPQAADLENGGDVLAVLSGPHAYISPRWYATAPAVPTWNYADVHAYGAARLIEVEARLRDFLHRLAQRYEGEAAGAWRIEDQPETFIAGMLKSIVGVEIRVDRLEGKFKLSQNRPAGDRPRIIAALEEGGNPESVAVARMMREREAG
jgi:transcriptional regulator